jgi:hypothetical protein
MNQSLLLSSNMQCHTSRDITLSTIYMLNASAQQSIPVNRGAQRHASYFLAHLDYGV